MKALIRHHLAGLLAGAGLSAVIASTFAVPTTTSYLVDVERISFSARAGVWDGPEPVHEAAPDIPPAEQPRPTDPVPESPPDGSPDPTEDPRPGETDPTVPPTTEPEPQPEPQPEPNPQPAPAPAPAPAPEEAPGAPEPAPVPGPSEPSSPAGANGAQDGSDPALLPEASTH